MTTPRRRRLYATLLCAPVLAFAMPTQAQLLSQTVNDATRTCVYAGSDVSAGGQVTPRVVVVGIGQECPAAAPYRDPSAPVPPNAQLTGEQTDARNRICLFREGGIEYRVTIDLNTRCGMTPALTSRDAAR